MIFYQVKLAYENVKEVDCLDTTKDGNEQWEDAMKRYEQRIDQVMFFIDQVVFVIKCFMLACVEVISKISRNSTEITLLTLGDIFKKLEMRRFFKEFAIFSDGQNFGFQNKIRRIIFDVFLLIVTSSITISTISY